MKKQGSKKIIKLQVSGWTKNSKYNCSGCQQTLSLNSDKEYVCEDCNIQMQPMMKMNFNL